MTRALLRGIAVAIAVAGLIDPVLSLERPVRSALSIVAVSRTADAASPATTAASAAIDRLSSLLASDFDVTVSRATPASRAAACPAAGACILVSDGSLPTRLSDGANLVGAVRVRDEAASVSIVGLRAPDDAQLTAASVLQVDLEATAPGGESTVDVFDGGALVGRAVHTWASREQSGVIRETVAVEWVPLETGPRRLRVVVATATGSHTADEAETAVNVKSLSVPIVLYEPETTWMGTFVRRALETDHRFQLAGRVQLTPTLAVTRGKGDRLRQATLRDAQVVIVSAAERLTAAEVELLDRFVRLRGGSVVLVPDAEVAGPMTRLMPAVDRTQQAEDPQTMGLLRARDIVSFKGTPEVVALARTSERVVVAARPIGRGRVVAFGALDAWRYRDDGGFNRFWTSLVAEAASAAGPGLSARLDRSLLEPGESTEVHIDWRSLDDLPQTISVEAIVDCGGERDTIRLWPEGRPGAFAGSVEARRVGLCSVTASIDAAPRTAAAAFVTAANVRRPVPDSATFERTIAARGGTVVGTAELDALATRARGTRTPLREAQDTWPMHSPWWVVPFAGCLGGEWLFRRRAGLR